MMLDLEWMSLLLGLALSVDLVCATCRHWHAKQLAIKRDTTLKAKFALSPHRTGAVS
jgi:hypothetical protein